ncbi:MAG: hypothetical protein KKD12_04355 [Proteobacteria bacterium]|nr:hypothetical protein [Pseudomonadota bacterium]
MSQKVTPEQGLTEEDLAEAKDELEVIHTSIQRDIASSQLNELYKTPSSRIEREKEIERMAGLAEDWKDRYDDILIIGGEESGAHMAFRALTEEKWNELSKSERKNFPKIHFVNIGNVAEIADAINLEKTGIVVIGNSISQSNLGAFRLLEKGYSTKGVPIIPRVSIVGTLDGTLFPALGRQAIPLENQFSIPEGLEDMDSFFSAAGLLPLILAGKIKEAENILAGADSAAEAISDIDLSTPATGIPAIFRHPEYMHPGIIAKLYEKKGKNICIYSPFSEKLRLFGVWASDQFNSIVGRKKDNRLVFQGAVGTRHNHASLQSWQKGHNMFQVVTLGVDEFRSVLDAGRSSYNLFRGSEVQRFRGSEVQRFGGRRLLVISY